MRNAFVAMCELASKENWCWKITCTTCGHMYFRYAFKELVRGKHPDSYYWIVKNQKHRLFTTLLGGIPQLTPDEQRTLIEIVAGANLKEIHETSTFPDWLGYLGLVLVHTWEVESECKILTKLITPQLIEMCSGDAHVVRYYSERMKEDDFCLSPYCLEQAEFSLDNKYVIR